MQTINFETNGHTVRTTLVCTKDEWDAILAALEYAEEKDSSPNSESAQCEHEKVVVSDDGKGWECARCHERLS